MRYIFRAATLTVKVLSVPHQQRKRYIALAEGCTLVTRNVEDFRRVDGLNILNPFEDS